MIKRIEGVGLPDPNECKHPDLEKEAECAICSKCNAILPLEEYEKTANASEDTPWEDMPNVQLNF